MPLANGLALRFFQVTSKGASQNRLWEFGVMETVRTGGNKRADFNKIVETHLKKVL